MTALSTRTLLLTLEMAEQTPPPLPHPRPIPSPLPSTNSSLSKPPLALYPCALNRCSPIREFSAEGFSMFAHEASCTTKAIDCDA